MFFLWFILISKTPCLWEECRIMTLHLKAGKYIQLTCGRGPWSLTLLKCFQHNLKCFDDVLSGRQTVFSLTASWTVQTILNSVCCAGIFWCTFLHASIALCQKYETIMFEVIRADVIWGVKHGLHKSEQDECLRSSWQNQLCNGIIWILIHHIFVTFKSGFVP